MGIDGPRRKDKGDTCRGRQGRYLEREAMLNAVGAGGRQGMPKDGAQSAPAHATCRLVSADTMPQSVNPCQPVTACLATTRPPAQQGCLQQHVSMRGVPTAAHEHMSTWACEQVWLQRAPCLLCAASPGLHYRLLTLCPAAY